MRMFSKTHMGRFIAGGSDQVVGHVGLPAMGKLLNVWGAVDIWQPAAVPITDLQAYAIRGAILDIGDTDNAITVDGLWDAIMPKDQPLGSTAATQQIDFERTTASTPEFDDFGEVDVFAIWGVKSPATEIWDASGVLTYASSPSGFDIGAPITYHPRAAFNTRVKRKYQVDSHSYGMFAVGNPDIAGETATIPVVVNDEEWFMLGFLEYVLEQAWVQIIGLTEAGAESPYDLLTQFIERMVEPQVVLETSLDFATDELMAYGQHTWEIQVPGRPSFGVVSSG